jgi:hypothetical protein
LLDVCEGKFAVFKGDQYLGTFDSYLAAYEAGLKAWGNVPFPVKQALREEMLRNDASARPGAPTKTGIQSRKIRASTS